MAVVCQSNVITSKRDDTKQQHCSIHGLISCIFRNVQEMAIVMFQFENCCFWNPSVVSWGSHTKKEYWCSSTLFCLISWWYERSKRRGPHPPSVLYSCPTILIKTPTYARFEFWQMTQLGKMGKRSRKVLCSQMNLTRIEKNKENEICCNYFLSILLLQLNIFFMITMSVAGFARD